jgi:polyphosphate kinase 2 (PPK2 family)
MVFQAMDAAGKDGTIRHVMSGVNPQGCQVFSFKAPSAEERDHDYLWRTMKALPERGRIGIHNRSYYEEVLVCRVHPKILASQQLPADRTNDGVWKRRFEQINNFEHYLVDNGIRILKFYLNVSKKEQKRRFLERIDLDDKNWKFSVNDEKSGQSGKTTCTRTRTSSRTPAPSTRPGTSSRPTTNGSCGWPSRRSRIRRSTT